MLARSYICRGFSCFSHLCAYLFFFSFGLHKLLRCQGRHGYFHWIDQDPKVCPGQDHKGGAQASHIHILGWTLCPDDFCQKGSLATRKTSRLYFVAEGVVAWAKSLLPFLFTAQVTFVRRRDLWLQHSCVYNFTQISYLAS